MGVNLSIKDVPDELAQRLRERAARHHRSLQGELMAIVEAAALEPATTTRGATGPTGVDLLAALDAIVAGSQWGTAPLLTRAQLHDRAGAREADLQSREAELAHARSGDRSRSSPRRDA